MGGFLFPPFCPRCHSKLIFGDSDLGLLMPFLAGRFIHVDLHILYLRLDLR